MCMFDVQGNEIIAPHTTVFEFLRNPGVAPRGFSLGIGPQ